MVHAQYMFNNDDDNNIIIIIIIILLFSHKGDNDKASRCRKWLWIRFSYLYLRLKNNTKSINRSLRTSSKRGGKATTGSTSLFPGCQNGGRPRTTYIDTTKADTGLDNTKETRDAMLDQAVWKDFVGMTRGDSQLKCVSALCTRFPLVKTSWKTISKYVHNSAANASHFPAVDQRIQGWIEKRQCQRVTQ